MSRKDWSESRRRDEIRELIDKIDFLEKKLSHLLGDDWEKPYPKN